MEKTKELFLLVGQILYSRVSIEEGVIVYSELLDKTGLFSVVAE